jgi:hypothetical protein
VCILKGTGQTRFKTGHKLYQFGRSSFKYASPFNVVYTIRVVFILLKLDIL